MPMDAAITTYVQTILTVLVIAVVAVVLFSLVRRARKEVSIVGFRAKSKDEKFAGYSLLVVGFVVILFSVYQILALLDGGFSTNPFNLMDIIVNSNGQLSVLASGQLLSNIAAVVFWLLLLSFGGRKIAVLGLDLLRGQQVKIRRQSLKKPKTTVAPS
jgi:hypothetical protein